MSEEKQVTKADLMKEILGIRRNPEKKVLVKSAEKPAEKDPSLNKTAVISSPASLDS